MLRHRLGAVASMIVVLPLACGPAGQGNGGEPTTANPNPASTLSLPSAPSGKRVK